MNRLRFLHIPKTGGTSFDECLHLMFLRAHLRICWFTFSGNLHEDITRWQRMSARQRRRTRLFIGHAPRVTGIDEIDQLPTITMLRDPVSRVKSLCQHIMDGKSPAILNTAAGESMDLDELLDSGRQQLSNHQSRMLLGEKNYALPRLETDSQIKMAVQVLDSDLTAFGLTSDFNHSMLLIADALGWRNPPPYRTLNTGGSGNQLEFLPRHIDKIVALNQLDIRVYEQAEALFRARVEHLPNVTERAAHYVASLRQPHPLFHLVDLGRVVRRRRTDVSR